MKLLIVDDNKYVVTGIAHQIDWNALGVQDVRGVYSVHQARELLKQEHFDLVLVDIEMPGEDGFGLIHWIREQEIPIRIVILTSFAEYPYAEKAIFYHVYAYLLKPVSDEKLTSVFRALISDERQRRENKRFAEMGKRSTVPEDSDHDLITSVREYIRENLDSVTRSDISAKFYLSPDHLSKLFRKEQGMTLIEYIQHERMEQAKALLSRNNGLSIGQIAEATGYSSFAHFSKQFRKFVGISPSEYRKRGSKK